MTLENAIRNAVSECKKRGIMQPFLTKHASEVENMLLTDWNWDDAIRIEREEAREDGLAEGREEGRAAGRTEGKLELVKSLLGLLPDEVIAEKAGVALSVITQLKKGDATGSVT